MMQIEVYLQIMSCQPFCFFGKMLLLASRHVVQIHCQDMRGRG